jgi:replication factor A1
MYEMDFSEAADRISRKFQKSGQTVDPKKIEVKLRRLIEEFSVQPSEAERSVTNELAKEFNIPSMGAGSTGSGGTGSSGTEDKKIADAAPGEWVTIEGKIVALAAPASPSIAQGGIIADDSGAIRFVAWAKANAPVMAVGSWYRIESAVVDEFKGIASLKIHSGTTIKEIEEDRSHITVANPNINSNFGGSHEIPEKKKISETIPGEWTTVEGKVVSISIPTSPSIAQSGIIADESGATRFVAWAKANALVLEKDAWYRIESAKVDEYKGITNLQINSGTKIKTLNAENLIINPFTVPIKELRIGVSGIRAKVLQEWNTTHERMLQSGLLGDETGTVKFVIWKEQGIEKLALGKVYSIFYVPVDEFNGRVSLNLNTATIMPDDGDITVSAQSLIKINELKSEFGSIRAKVIEDWGTSHESILQSGMLGDETGSIKFVIWKAPLSGICGPLYEDDYGTIKSVIWINPGKEKLDMDSVYNIFFAPVDLYNDRSSLNLSTAMIMKEQGNIEVIGVVTVSGAIVHVAPGSGLIKRCPVEGCNRALSRQNYCPVHEIQPKFTYDLRIKGWLDNGEKTHSVLLQRDVVESLTSISLDAAKEIAENNPLGMDEVFLQMREKILGRYFTCQGRKNDNHILVNKCELVVFESGKHTALLDRAGGGYD